MMFALVEVDPGAWWVVIKEIVTEHWYKALLIAGVYMVYKLILAKINRSGG